MRFAMAAIELFFGVEHVVAGALDVGEHPVGRRPEEHEQKSKGRQQIIDDRRQCERPFAGALLELLHDQKQLVQLAAEAPGADGDDEHAEDGDEEVQQVKGMFNIVNMLNEIKKNGILSKVNDKILMKLLGLSSIGLLLQLRYNKKARDCIVNSFMYMGFSMVFVLFGSSLALIVVKNLKSKGKKGKKLTKSEENIVEKP